MDEYVMYEDENGIKITARKFITGSRKYKLAELENIHFHRVPPSRLPTFYFFVAGIFSLMIGSVGIIGNINPEWNPFALRGDVETYYLAGGVVFVLVSAIIMVFQQDRYAIRAEIDGTETELYISPHRNHTAHLTGVLIRTHSRFVPPGLR